MPTTLNWLAFWPEHGQADESWIVTLTAGEIEAEHYQQMGLPKADAARIKDACVPGTALPYRAGPAVPEARCVQLGYFCLQLPAMAATLHDSPRRPRSATGRYAAVPPVQCLALPSDADGAPTWNNLIADLRAVLLKARPRSSWYRPRCSDPHPDHICAHAAVVQALEGLNGSRPRCSVIPTTCMIMTAGPWAIPVPAWRCRAVRCDGTTQVLPGADPRPTAGQGDGAGHDA